MEQPRRKTIKTLQDRENKEYDNSLYMFISIIVIMFMWSFWMLLDVRDYSSMSEDFMVNVSFFLLLLVFAIFTANMIVSIPYITKTDTICTERSCLTCKWCSHTLDGYFCEHEGLYYMRIDNQQQSAIMGNQWKPKVVKAYIVGNKCDFVRNTDTTWNDRELCGTCGKWWENKNS